MMNSAMKTFEEYVAALPQKRKKHDGSWKATQINPCPLLLRCCKCCEYIPTTDFYTLSATNKGRIDATGTRRASRCPRCNMDDYFASDPRRKLLYSAKGRARERGLEFTLTIDDIVIPEYCPVLGIKLEASIRTGTLPINRLCSSPTIDRIDNNEGYTVPNSRVISHRANALKNNGTYEELKRLVEYMERELEQKRIMEQALKTTHTSPEMGVER
jgi:hypothetical protein